MAFPTASRAFKLLLSTFLFC